MKVIKLTFLYILSLYVSNSVYAVDSTENDIKKGENTKLVFSLKTNKITQQLIISSITEEKIKFSLQIYGICQREINGIAKAISTGPYGDYEMEIDTDKGYGYPSVAYRYIGPNDYVLRISVAAKAIGLKSDKAIVAEYNYDDKCPVIVKTMRLHE